MARKINEAPSTQITVLATDDILYVARPSGLTDHWIKAQRVSAIGPGEGDLQYYTGGIWTKTNGALSWDGSQLTIGGVPVTVQDELVGGQAASALLQTPTVAEDGYVVVWDNTAGEFTLSPFTEVLTLADMSDVDLTGAADNDLLFRSGGNWIDTAGLLTWDGATLKATGKIQVSGQAAGTPSIAGTVDTNTGFRWDTTDTNNLYFVGNGSDVIQFTSTGGIVANGAIRSGGGIYLNSADASLINVAASGSKFLLGTFGQYSFVSNSGGFTTLTAGAGVKLAVNNNPATVFLDVESTNSLLKIYTPEVRFSGFHRLAEVTPPTTDITGFGQLYPSNADGLLYWRDDVGNVYDLTAVASPGGADTQVQYNNGGVFGGISVLTYDDTENLLTYSPTLNNATGDEIGFTYNLTVNKATSGFYNALKINITETNAPETQNIIYDFQIDGLSRSRLEAGSNSFLFIQSLAENELVFYRDIDILNGNRLGQITFYGDDTDLTNHEGARIEVTANGTWSGSNGGTIMSFYTTNAGSTSQVKRLSLINESIEIYEKLFLPNTTSHIIVGDSTLDWANSNYIGIEAPRGTGQVWKILGTGNPESYYFNNLYHNGTNWVHKETNTSAIYSLGWNGHYFYANASQTADTATAFLLGLSIVNASSVVEVSIAPSTGAKMGFFTASPITQPTTGISAASFVANSSGISDDTATFGGYTLGQIAAALQLIGILT